MQVLIILAISLLVATIVFFVALAAERRTATDASEQTLGPQWPTFRVPCRRGLLRQCQFSG